MAMLVLGLGRAPGQQRAQYSQYMLNGYLLNPAMGGTEDFADVKLGYRNQWVGFEGAPVTAYLSGHLALGKPDRTSYAPDFGQRRDLTRVFDGQPAGPGHHGVGALLVSDRTGPTSRTSFDLSYAWHQPLTARLKLSVGVAAGFTQHTLDFDQLRLLNPQDALAQQGKINVTTPDLNLGLLLYSRRWYVGASAQQVLFRTLDYGSGLPSGGAYSWLARLYTHYFLTGGVRLPLSEDWVFVPSVLVKAVQNAPTSYDLNGRLQYQDRLWVGLSYRRNDAVVGLVGFYLSPLLNLSYSYDFTFSNLNVVSRGTHEIVLGLQLRNRQKLLCPRNVF
jgi:type IX secretion system PorP/SprF family membrane protein